MKAIKLTVLFLLLAGGLMLALNWKSIIHSSDNGEDFPPEDLINISEKCNEIRQAWEQCSGWDEGLYTTLRADIDQSKAMGMFSREGYNTVNNTLRETTTNKTCDGYLEALHNKASFSDATLQAQYKGVQYIKQQEGLDKDQRIAEVETRHKLYENIKQFVNSRHAIVPKLDTLNLQWEAFATLQGRVLNTAAGYRKNSLYTAEMTHIPGFQKGLDEANLTTLTNRQRSDFYEGLSSQLIDCFKEKQPTPDNVERLNQAYKDFSGQETNYGIGSLAAFKVKYKED